MRLLFTTESLDDAEEARLLLEGKGIPIVFTSNTWGTRHLGGTITSVWVAVDAQYEDAVKVLREPEAEALEPVDAAVFQTLLDAGRPRTIIFLPSLSLDQVMPVVLTVGLLGFGLFVADRILKISWLPW